MLEELKIALLEHDRSVNRKAWAKKIVAASVDLKDWLPELEGEKRLATRFLWLFGDVAEKNPAQIKPLITTIYKNRDTYKIPGVHRSLAKWVWLAGAPEEIEGELLDVLIEWVLHPKTEKAVRCYAVEAFYGYAKKYPELIPELKLVLEEALLHAPSYSFKNRCYKLLDSFKP